MSKESTEEKCCPTTEKKCCSTFNLEMNFASLLLRLWLGVRAVQTGLEKYSIKVNSDELVKIGGDPNKYGLTSNEKGKIYGLDFYHGVPEGMMKMFKKEPFMLKFALPIYDMVLGPALILLGLTILLGVGYRSSLFLLGVLYVSLTWGLILINQNDGVAWLGIHMILIVMALALAKHDRFVILKKW
jgi:thiosulfate dehydrogenase [quinone] large subunit